ncbi:MAG TPA: hypothetical protein VF062_09400 [Candidatus Limnocylindrales bacterium]
MLRRTLFQDPMPVAYGQFYVTGDDDDFLDLTESFAGQSNGLCGAAVQGGLFLITGTHSGHVQLTVELHDGQPPEATGGWEEVVEVPFLPASTMIHLQAWGGEGWWDLHLESNPGNGFRVRYCASGMDRGREQVGADLDELAQDEYLLQLWPIGDQVPRPDAVLRQASSHAAYWHGYAHSLPAPPTPEQRAEAERLALLERERRTEELRLRDEARRWGGRPPSERLRQVVGNVFGIANLDRDLVDGVAEADPRTQRRIARWAARHAFTHAGIADRDWLAPVWEALDRDEPLPAPFDDPDELWRRFRPSGEEVYYESFAVFSQGGATDPFAHIFGGDVLGSGVEVDPVSMAVPALTAATAPDPLQAALEALWAAATAYGRDVPAFLATVRREFPEVA